VFAPARIGKGLQPYEARPPNREDDLVIPVRVSIIYYSSTGSVHTMADAAADAAEKAGADVRVRRAPELAPEQAIQSNDAWVRNVADTQHIPEAAPEDIVEADVVVFGTPTRYGNVAAQLKQFLDSLGPNWQRGELADKVYAGFTSTATEHGGQETTLLALYNTMYHFGGIIVPPGYTDPSKYVDGNPYGVSHVAGQGDRPVGDVEVTALEHMVTRCISVARRLKTGAEVVDAEADRTGR
jgi:NAD(P)H dehydrogenase (quinone)